VQQLCYISKNNSDLDKTSNNSSSAGLPVSLEMSGIRLPRQHRSGGAGTNLKGGGGGTVRRKSGGHRSGAKVRARPPLFGSKSTISHFGRRFRDGQYSLVSFFFAVLLLMSE